jgi:predicted GNAT family acetyltransferase
LNPASQGVRKRGEPPPKVPVRYEHDDFKDTELVKKHLPQQKKRKGRAKDIKRTRGGVMVEVEILEKNEKGEVVVVATKRRHGPDKIVKAHLTKEAERALETVIEEAISDYNAGLNEKALVGHEHQF